MNRALILFYFLLASMIGYSQEPQMADVFRQEGKIYVVIGVLVLVLLSIAFVLFIIERRLARLEKELGQKQNENKE